MEGMLSNSNYEGKGIIKTSFFLALQAFLILQLECGNFHQLHHICCLSRLLGRSSMSSLRIFTIPLPNHSVHASVALPLTGLSVKALQAQRNASHAYTAMSR